MKPGPDSYDGVICFGGVDWWYHNRGHYDLQMMRRFGERMPVLYVNSIGIRVPKVVEGGVFFARVNRKLKSLRRGFVRVSERFGVFSPFVVPGRLGMAVSRPILVPQVRSAAHRMGIQRPLVWVTCPPGAAAVDGLSPACVVYERTDRWEEFPDANAEQIRGYDRFMKQRADLSLYCSTLLFEEEGPGCRCAAYVDHGVDFEPFVAAGIAADAGVPEPADLANLARPRVGFIGSINSHTFDAGLFLAIARELSDVNFFLLGTCTLPNGWCTLPNVRLLGKRAYEEVPPYMAAADVLIMPWAQNEWIRACNPIKLKEYLASGRPIVSTDFYELKRYDQFVRRASCAGEFAAQVRAAIRDGCDREAHRKRVQEETWDNKARQVIDRLSALGFSHRPPSRRASA